MFNAIKKLIEKNYSVDFIENNNNRFIYSRDKDLTDTTLCTLNKKIEGFNCFFERTNLRMAVLKRLN
jgi:hypothetical protein